MQLNRLHRLSQLLLRPRRVPAQIIMATPQKSRTSTRTTPRKEVSTLSARASTTPKTPKADTSVKKRAASSSARSAAQNGRDAAADVSSTPSKKKRKTTDQEENGASHPHTNKPTPNSRGKKLDSGRKIPDEANATPKKRQKTKAEKEADLLPLAQRTPGIRMYVGAHVSCATGVQKTIPNAMHIGGNAFAMFLKAHRTWKSPPLQEENVTLFKSYCSEHGYDAAQHVLPHGSYLVNLAQEDPEKAKQAYDHFRDDLQRCERLGIRLFNFHPGFTGSAPRPDAIGRIAAALNRSTREIPTVVPVLEAMAGSTNTIGSTFEDIRDIIALIDDKTRIGVCIDTCHVFANGYDLRSPAAFKKTLQHFENVVGLKYLRALHLNDSKAPFESRRDLHQNIGLGFLGLRAFHNVMNESRFANLPLILETPSSKKNEESGKEMEDKSIWANEIKLLESLTGMDPEGSEFKKLEKSLADKGAAERKKYAEAFEKSSAKREKKLAAPEKGQTALNFGQGKKKASGAKS